MAISASRCCEGGQGHWKTSPLFYWKKNNTFDDITVFFLENSANSEEISEHTDIQPWWWGWSTVKLFIVQSANLVNMRAGGHN